VSTPWAKNRPPCVRTLTPLEFGGPRLRRSTEAVRGGLRRGGIPRVRGRPVSRQNSVNIHPPPALRAVVGHDLQHTTQTNQTRGFSPTIARAPWLSCFSTANVPGITRHVFPWGTTAVMAEKPMRRPIPPARSRPSPRCRFRSARGRGLSPVGGPALRRGPRRA